MALLWLVTVFVVLLALTLAGNPVPVTLLVTVGFGLNCGTTGLEGFCEFRVGESEMEF